MSEYEAENEIPWPSFVDILSAVIMMFIFFILITTIIMATMTVKTQIDLNGEAEAIAQQQQQQQDMQQAQQQQDMQQAQQQQQQDMQQAQQAGESEGSEDQKDQSNQIESLRTALAKATEQRIETNTQLREMTIFFMRNEVALSEETENDIKDLLVEAYDSTPNAKVFLESSRNPQMISELHSREQALARSLNIRNVMIEHDIEPTNIVMKQGRPLKIMDSFDWVKIKIQK